MIYPTDIMRYMVHNVRHLNKFY